MGIEFPFFGDIELPNVNVNENKDAYDVAWDYKLNKPLVNINKFVFVEKQDAVLSWCYRALNCVKGRYEIYSNSYGQELEGLIGGTWSKAFVLAESQRYIEECLSQNQFVIGVGDIDVSFDNKLLTIKCTIKTKYDYSDMEVSI